MGSRKSPKSLWLEVVGSQTKIADGKSQKKKKNRNLEGRREGQFWNSEDMGVEHFGICEGKGVKFVHAAHGRVWIFSGITHC